MLDLDFYQIPIRPVLKRDMYSPVVISFVSWKSSKTNYGCHFFQSFEVLAIHEASRECVWLRNMIEHIQESCGLPSIKDSPTILYEDNAACITQLSEGFIKGDRTKHISPKFFYAHELQKNGEIDVKQIRSSDNLADLFTKALPTTTFKRLTYGIGLRKLKDIASKETEQVSPMFT
ncbi:hypothetical protein Sjap_019531 [Stephania japonica]|uniref:Uncharacterized protein n=1 Tax=Stephania japonica TaxID=461633 RepID=A0AAP0F1T1_9MAGN